MDKKLSGNDFKWVKETPKFNVDFIKCFNYDSYEEYFLEVDVQKITNMFQKFT